MASEIIIKRHGGARVGAGRKRGSGAGLKEKLQVCVTAEQLQIFKRFGGAKWVRTQLDLQKNLGNAAGSHGGVTYRVTCFTSMMKDAGVSPSDELVIDKFRMPENGDIVVVQFGPQIFLCRYRICDDMVELRFENKDVPTPTVYVKKTDKSWAVLGVVVEIVKHQ